MRGGRDLKRNLRTQKSQQRRVPVRKGQSVFRVTYPTCCAPLCSGEGRDVKIADEAEEAIGLGVWCSPATALFVLPLPGEAMGRHDFHARKANAG